MALGQFPAYVLGEGGAVRVDEREVLDEDSAAGGVKPGATPGSAVRRAPFGDRSGQAIS